MAPLDPNPTRWTRSQCAWVIAAVFSPVLLTAWRPFYDGDSAQNAEVARNMVASGNWVAMADGFGPWLNKPPLNMWLMAGSMRLFGVSSLAGRLPILLLGLLLLGLTFRLGEILYDRRTGLIAACFVGTSVAFQLMVADPKIDLCLVTCITGTVLCAVEARWVEAGVMAGLGFLTKGPIGMVVPFLAVAPETVVTRRWPRVLPVLGGALAAVGIAVLWLYLQFPDWGWGGVRYYVWVIGGGRLTGADWKNDAGPLFFLHTGLWAFLPFSLLVPRAIWRQFRRRETGLVPIAWFLLTLIAISAASYKLPQYMFPILPAAALLAARHLPAWTRWLGLALAVVVAGIALLVLGWCFRASMLATALWMIGICGALALAWFGARHLQGQEQLAALLVAPLFVFSIFYEGYFYPAMLAYQPAERIGALVRASDPEGKLLPTSGFEPGNAPGFYAQRPTHPSDEAELAKVVRENLAHVAELSPDAAATLTQHGWRVDVLGRFDSFQISKPTRAFLLARTRASVLEHLIVARVVPP